MLVPDVPDGARAPFDVVALVASAGGLDALSTVLRELPRDLPAAVILMQHLGGQGSALVGILARRTTLPVTWVEDGTPLAAGQVYVCPPRQRVEVLPDATCALSPAQRGALDGPFDGLLESLADSFGARALGVVLTGMGRDGAAGALALKLAGGTVLVQSTDTAEQPSMPRAVIENGAADLVLPLHDIGPAIADVVAGGRLPRAHTEVEAAAVLFAGSGEVSILLREIDWARTSLGPVSRWPASLRTALRLVLESPMPAIVLWGADHVQLYNDHYRALMADKHPAGLGQPNRACWPEVWLLNAPLYARVSAGESVALRRALYPITRHGSLENAWFDLFYAPVRDEQGAVAGVLGTIFETTTEVLAERRLQTLHRLSTEATGATTTRAALQRAVATLAGSAQDVPYALGYLLDATGTRAQLVAAAGVDAGTPMAPHTVDLRGGHPAWPLARAIGDATPVLLDDLAARFRGCSTGRAEVGPDATGPASAILLPLRLVGDEQPAGVLVAGVSPRLPLTAAYREFLELVAAQVGTNLGQARARQHERERLDRLTELDRIKTEFFSNVSHEFRTPLTLLLAPMDELLRQREALPAALADEVEVAARNARRLLTLVNTLLDFSRLEAGRLRAHFEPTDLAALTVDVASVFRSAAERAGLALRVDCPPLPGGPVWVDRQMWERVVSNLISNALKFTFAGEVMVELRTLRQHAQLAVRDTGVGIPRAELPHVFERFHRVRGARARTHEGSGIGLALVHELVRQHGGRVRVASDEEDGTTLTVWVPLGPRAAARSAADQPAVPPDTALAPAPIAAALADEAMRWDVPGVAPPTAAVPPAGAPDASDAARVLVVDDNADMRDYLRRVLAAHGWTVDTARDGVEALACARAAPPDVILADVMMPTLDGFGLLRRVREDPRLCATPVVLVTARAGEETTIEGLAAGADDYLSKPFSARELVARVGAQLARARRASGDVGAPTPDASDVDITALRAPPLLVPPPSRRTRS